MSYVKASEGVCEQRKDDCEKRIILFILKVLLSKYSKTLDVQVLLQLNIFCN